MILFGKAAPVLVADSFMLLFETPLLLITLCFARIQQQSNPDIQVCCHHNLICY